MQVIIRSSYKYTTPTQKSIKYYIILFTIVKWVKKSIVDNKITFKYFHVNLI